jgi:2-amino-4-hydroxy-6-hydroxymethyldihydropteridine diphosphokinase
MIVYLGLGSNLGDSRQILLDAVKALEEVLSGIRMASLYETKPLYVTDQGYYINTVVEGNYEPVQASSPTASTRALLSRLHELEARFGRNRAKERRWGERFLDIDILLFGDSIISEADITIPHPRLKERRFALEPLLELFPEATEPGTGLFYRDFCTVLPDQGVRIIDFTTNHTNHKSLQGSR